MDPHVQAVLYVYQLPYDFWFGCPEPEPYLPLNHFFHKIGVSGVLAIGSKVVAHCFVLLILMLVWLHTHRVISVVLPYLLYHVAVYR